MEKTKILILEDDLIQAEEMAFIVRQANFEVVAIANTAIQAIQLAEMHRPDVLLCDVILDTGKTGSTVSQLDGIQAAALIRQTCPSPVIFLTNDRSLETKNRIKRTGEFYLPKPFTRPQLIDAIEYALIESETEKVSPRKVLEMNGCYFFFERNSSGFHKVDVNDILFIESKKHNTSFTLKNNRTFDVSIAIGELVEIFREPEMVQVQRSYLVNIKNVEAVKGSFLLFPGGQKVSWSELFIPNPDRIFPFVKRR